MELRRQLEAILSARTVEVAWRHYGAWLQEAGFPHLIYFSHRILRTADQQVIDEALELSTLPGGLWEEILAGGLRYHLPMLRWITRNHGCHSWSWIAERQARGKVTESEAHCLALFHRHGLRAGHAISLSDKVPRTRGGILLIGRPGAAQDELDRIWDGQGGDIELLTLALHQRLASLPHRDPPLALTSRQREALELTGIGFTTAEIAARLALTPATVEKHLRLARQNLGARTTAQAILMATSRRQIFIDLGEPCNQPQTSAQTGGTPWAYLGFPGAAGAAPAAALAPVDA